MCTSSLFHGMDPLCDSIRWSKNICYKNRGWIVTLFKFGLFLKFWEVIQVCWFKLSMYQNKFDIWRNWMNDENFARAPIEICLYMCLVRISRLLLVLCIFLPWYVLETWDKISTTCIVFKTFSNFHWSSFSNFYNLLKDSKTYIKLLVLGRNRITINQMKTIHPLNHEQLI